MQSVRREVAQLREACWQWQSGRDGGSSLLRGAARVHTGIPHYFSAGFIKEFDDAARKDVRAMEYGAVLLRSVYESDALTAAEWRERCGLSSGSFAGRGLKSAPQDEQIETVLQTGEITMPLWGVSLVSAPGENWATCAG